MASEQEFTNNKFLAKLQETFTNSVHEPQFVERPVSEIDNEFDIQFSLLKQKKKKEQNFYVMFDIISGQILEISPVKMQPSAVRYSVVETVYDELISDIMNSRIPYNRVAVKFDRKKRKHILVRAERPRNRQQSILSHAVFNTANAPIIVEFDYVFKKVCFTLNSEAYRNYISNVDISENQFSDLETVKFYFIKSQDYSYLLGTTQIDLHELLEHGRIEKSARWLPNYNNDDVVVMHSNIKFNIAVSSAPLAAEEIQSVIRPQILYKQQDSVLFLQSIMENPDNYKVRDVVNLFIHKHNDPAFLLGKISIDKAKFKNFGTFNLVMNYKEKVKVSTDHTYLYIEDNDVSTYYKF